MPMDMDFPERGALHNVSGRYQHLTRQSADLCIHALAWQLWSLRKSVQVTVLRNNQFLNEP